MRLSLNLIISGDRRAVMDRLLIGLCDRGKGAAHLPAAGIAAVASAAVRVGGSVVWLGRVRQRQRGELLLV